MARPAVSSLLRDPPQEFLGSSSRSDILRFGDVKDYRGTMGWSAGNRIVSHQTGGIRSTFARRPQVREAWPSASGVSRVQSRTIVPPKEGVPVIPQLLAVDDFDAVLERCVHVSVQAREDAYGTAERKDARQGKAPEREQGQLAIWRHHACLPLLCGRQARTCTELGATD